MVWSLRKPCFSSRISVKGFSWSEQMIAWNAHCFSWQWAYTTDVLVLRSAISVKYAGNVPCCCISWTWGTSGVCYFSQYSGRQNNCLVPAILVRKNHAHKRSEVYLWRCDLHKYFANIAGQLKYKLITYSYMPTLLRLLLAKWSQVYMMVLDLLNTMIQILWQYLGFWWNEVNFWSTPVGFDTLFYICVQCENSDVRMQTFTLNIVV